MRGSAQRWKEPEKKGLVWKTFRPPGHFITHRDLFSGFPEEEPLFTLNKQPLLTFNIFLTWVALPFLPPIYLVAGAFVSPSGLFLPGYTGFHRTSMGCVAGKQH